MSIVAALSAEFKRLEEELQPPGGKRQWDEKTPQYNNSVRTIFHTRK